MIRPTARLMLALLTIACRLPAQTRATAPIVMSSSPFADHRLTESSGIVRSRRLAGVLYTINDSGNEPLLFATDSTGRALGAWRVTGTSNIDWEMMSAGPCPEGDCVYIGDTGDNDEERPEVTLYRFPEPGTMDLFRGVGKPPTVETLVFRYPDHPHDVEAMYLDNAANVYLITKGRSGSVDLFRIPADAWRHQGAVTAQATGHLPITPDRGLGRWITDAARSPDGRRLAVRTYTEIYLFGLGPDGAPTGKPSAVCNVAGLEPQGEGVDWLDDHRLVLSSEQRNGMPGTITVLRCF